ncbi:MAG: hypothetical protein ABI772_13070 [Bacteroidota bacterium]
MNTKNEKQGMSNVEVTLFNHKNHQCHNDLRSFWKCNLTAKCAREKRKEPQSQIYFLCGSMRKN